MKSVQSLAVLGFAAVVQAGYYANTTSEAVEYTTVTTDVYTTFCPEATTFTQGTKTYTATASETLTITDCPCTLSHPVYTAKPTASSVIPPPVYITKTEVVKTYTTYCPEATTVVQGNQTYTAHGATTLTITNCPCTQTTTVPATTSSVKVGTTTTYCPVPTTIVTGGSTYPVHSATVVTLPVYSPTVVPVESAPATKPEVPATYPAAPAPSTVTSAYVTGTTPAAATPTQVTTNGAAAQQVGLGAMVAGLIAMVL